MANKNRFLIARNDIVAYLDGSNQAVQAVFQRRELERIFAEQRDGWRLAKTLLARDFIGLLIQHTPLREIVLPFPGASKTLFAWRGPTAYELATHLQPGAYLSHYSALYLHGLTEQIPKQIYVNAEQSPKPPPPGAALTQQEVDAAFAAPPRLTRAHARYGDYTVVLLNGKYTGRQGVVSLTHGQAGQVALTSVERTLLDVAVRPEYAGGVYEVREAYRRAAPLVSINKLAALLARLGYRYPYHQVVGFYLARAGVYRPAQVQLLKKLAQPLDFYLSHGLEATAYDPEWRLYYPAGF